MSKLDEVIAKYVDAGVIDIKNVARREISNRLVAYAPDRRSKLSADAVTMIIERGVASAFRQAAEVLDNLAIDIEARMQDEQEAREKKEREDSEALAAAYRAFPEDGTRFKP